MGLDELRERAGRGDQTAVAEFQRDYAPLVERVVSRALRLADKRLANDCGQSHEFQVKLIEPIESAGEQRWRVRLVMARLFQRLGFGAIPLEDTLAVQIGKATIRQPVPAARAAAKR